MKLRVRISALLFTMSYALPGAAADATERESLSVLRKAVLSPAFWVKVHAIEFLIELDYREEAMRYTDDQLAAFEQTPQNRIGFWRCRYRLSDSEKMREKWLNKIRNAYLDIGGPDRIHAAETLAKLGFSLQNLDDKLVESDLKSNTDLAAFAFWGYCLPKHRGAHADFDQLLSGLDHENSGFRKITAYSLGFIPGFPVTKWPSMAAKALKEPETSVAYPYLLGAAYILNRSNNKTGLAARVKTKLLVLKDTQDKSSRIELCRALAARPDRSDLSLLLDLLHVKVPLRPLPGGSQSEADAANEDVQIAAAYGILCIKNNISN
jgi:hypothetical protein